jgi:hypothetical protein
MTMTDRHRQRCYDAEDWAFGGTILDEPLSWDDLSALFEAVLHSEWWQSLSVTSPQLRRTRSDSARSSADGTSIRLAAVGQNSVTLVHELSHHLVASLDLVDAGHGPEFRAAALRVMQVVGGTRSRQLLDDAWHHHRLPVAPWTFGEPASDDGLAASLVDAGPDRLRGAIPLPATACSASPPPRDIVPPW